MGSLYEQLLKAIAPMESRAGESLQGFSARFAVIRAKQEEKRKLEAKLKSEKQFKKRVSINSELKRIDLELKTLIDAGGTLF
jgi:hypothetical protein